MRDADILLVDTLLNPPDGTKVGNGGAVLGERADVKVSADDDKMGSEEEEDNVSVGTEGVADGVPSLESTLVMGRDTLGNKVSSSERPAVTPAGAPSRVGATGSERRVETLTGAPVASMN